MSKPIILFRFSERFDVCCERLELLHALSPKVPIYGLYGGPPGGFAAARAAISPWVVDLHATYERPTDWHWLHMDLDVKQWYRNVGHAVDFDVLFDYEWDILLTVNISSIYPRLDQDTIALSSVTKLTTAVEREWQWTGWPEYRPQFERFREYMKDRLGIGELEYVAHGPGSIFPKRFLERFADVEDIDMVISEISYSAYAQALGFRIVNSNIRRGSVVDVGDDAVFNTEGRTIKYERILAELMDPNGRRAFHPVKYSFSLSHLRQLQKLARRDGVARKAGVVWHTALPPASFICQSYPGAKRNRLALSAAYVRRLLGFARAGIRDRWSARRALGER